MRLEITIPDSTKAEYKTKLANLTELLSKNPELVADIYLDDDNEDTAIQRLFTPERLAIIDAADADMQAGNSVSMAELRERQAAIRAQWLAADPS